ncbi:alpha/beta hydrolase [Dysgonomonas sp. Marseille-P4677]|uniref:alpha/beta hydrolase n=1 Tax=Dysgonomonas sp. Marseille-P4677 TaxID=2364790 RepID=UPI001912BAAB|nr:alpha/beta hydrolase [Dysgonomonas sp. Marseille-P4677]MBK5721261.1 alpha/beta hydrolase [Dysgonomonas sp. Marseille-P4677]
MAQNENDKKSNPGFFRKLWQSIRGKKNNEKKEINVYFISGMCYNCSVFDKLNLPHGFKKVYIEWHIPREDESLSEYVHTMASAIDTSAPFVLVGYSFGAVIIQEMNRFLSPLKTIIISSFKNENEIPSLFRAAKKTNLVERVPRRVYSSTEFITNAFNRLVYNMSTEELADLMVYTDPVYIKWAIKQITEWIPGGNIKHLYHIHGTVDQIFPYENIRNAFSVEGGDHLMVIKKANVVSSILDGILLMQEV